MEIPTSSDVHATLCDVADALRAAADRVDRIATMFSDIDRGARQPDSRRSLVIDPEGLTVSWNGVTCYLGFTIPFRVLERLARRPGQYVTHEQLLQEIWGGPRSKSAIRSAVNDLRSRLVSAGMSDLADAIDGRNAGRYGLMLDGSH